MVINKPLITDEVEELDIKVPQVDFKEEESSVTNDNKSITVNKIPKYDSNKDDVLLDYDRRLQNPYQAALEKDILENPDLYNVTNNIDKVDVEAIPKLLEIDYDNSTKDLLKRAIYTNFKQNNDGTISADIHTDQGITVKTDDWEQWNINQTLPGLSNYETEQSINIYGTKFIAEDQFLAFEGDETTPLRDVFFYSQNQERMISKYQEALKAKNLPHDRQYAIIQLANLGYLDMGPMDIFDMKQSIGLRDNIFQDVYEITDDEEYKINYELARQQLVNQYQDFNNDMVAAQFGQPTVFGNKKAGNVIKRLYQDFSPFTYAMAIGEVTYDDVGGLIDLFGGTEDNYFTNKARMWQGFTQQGINEALINGNQALFWHRSLTGIGSDLFGNVMVLQKWIKLINGWTKGKKLSLVAKGKTYKELFATVTLRSMFMSAYTYATTPGSQKERGEAALWAMAYSMTPAISSLAKKDWIAIGQDIVLNGLMTFSDLDNRVVKPAQQETESIYGPRTEINATEWDKAYSSFYATKMVQSFAPDVVFGLLTRAVEGDTRLPSKIPVIGGWQFPSKSLASPKISRKTKSELINEKRKKIANNPVKIETEGILNLILNNKPTKQDFSTGIKDLETVTNTSPMSTVRRIAKIYSIKTGGRKKVDIVADINKAQKKINLGQQFSRTLKRLTREAQKIANRTMPEKKPIDESQPGKPAVTTIGQIKKMVKYPFTLANKYNQMFKLMTYRADDMDGGLGKQKGFFHNIYVKNINDGWANYHRNLQIRQEGFIQLLKGLKINATTFSKRFNYYKDKTLTLSELIGIYAKVRQKNGYETILKNNFVIGDPKNKLYDTEALNAAIKFIANVPAYKKVAEYLLLDYAKNYGRLRQTYEALTGKKLEVVDFYAPLFRIGDLSKNLKDIDDTTKLMETEIGKPYKNKSKQSVTEQTTFDRKEKGTGKVDLDIIGEWWRVISNQEYYIAQAKNVKTMDAVTKKIGEQYAEKFGRSELKSVNDYIKIAANPNKIWDPIDLSIKELNQISKFIRGNFSIAYLAYNTTVMLKQIPSILFFLQELGGSREGLARLFTSLSRITLATRVEFKKVKGVNVPILANPLMRQIQDLDPVLKSTSPNREIDEMRTTNPKLYNKVMRGFQKGYQANAKIGFMGILFFDKIVRHAGFDAIFQKALSASGSVDDAISIARDAIARSQPTNRATDLANIYSMGGERSRWLLMFSNQLLKIQNMIFNQLPRLLKMDNIKTVEGREKLSGLVCSLAVSAIYMWTINNGRPPETKEELLDALMMQGLAGSGPLGSYVGQVQQGYDYDIPAAKLIEETFETLKKVFSGEDIDWGWKDFDETLGGLGGVPTTQINRMRKYGESGDLKDLLWKQPKEPQGYEAPRLEGFEDVSRPFKNADPF